MTPLYPPSGGPCGASVPWVALYPSVGPAVPLPPSDGRSQASREFHDIVTRGLSWAFMGPTEKACSCTATIFGIIGIFGIRYQFLKLGVDFLHVL